MNIIVASCVFPPEPVVSARTSFDLATYLVSKGYNVQVVSPQPSRNISKGGDITSKFTFPVNRLFSIASRKSSFFSRFIENISFGISLFVYILKQKEIDAIYANTWPIFATGLLVIASKIKKIRVIVSVQDIYPESLVAQGRVSESSLLVKAILKIDKWIAQNCHHLIVLSDGFKNSYLFGRKISEGKISVIKNWVNSDDIQMLDKLVAREKLQQSDNFMIKDDDILCVYGGNIGFASGLDIFVSYIEKLDPRVKFLFAGDGALLPGLQKQIAERGLKARVKIISPWPVEMTSPVLCSADILLLSVAQGQEFASVPSKLITYMLSARPVLLIADDSSEPAREVLSASCGYVVSERTADAVVDCINRFSKLDNKAKYEMGRAGREYAEKNYSFSLAASKIENLLSGLSSDYSK